MKTIGLIILLFLSGLSFAENNIVKKENSSKQINGKIVDRLTGENLAGVKIEIPNSELVAYTDFDGNFSIQLPENAETTEANVSFISYEEIKINLLPTNEVFEIKILPITR